MGSRRVVGFVASAAFVLIALVRCGTLESNGQPPPEAGTQDDAPVPPPTPPPVPPAPPAPPPDTDGGHERVIQVTAGAYAACALTESHAVYCWGANNAGVTGGEIVGSTFCDANNPCRPPTLVKGLPSDVVEVKIGAHGACARTAKGEIFCWGSLGRYQLGVQIPASANNYTTLAVQQTGTPDASALRMRNTGGCVRTNDAAVWCWGTNDVGDLGRTSLLVPDGGIAGGDQGHPPAAVENLAPVDDLDLGQQGWIGCAHGSDGGAISCWGWNVYDVLGHPAGSPPDRIPNGAWLSERPTALDGGAYPALLGVGADFACARAPGNDVACWGTNTLGQHGIGADLLAHAAPRTIPDSGTFAKVRVGFAHVCGITSEGDLSCWGSNSRGEIGDDGGTDGGSGYRLYTTPHRVTGLPAIDDVALGFWFTIALDRNGDVWAFGANYFGQLGHESGDAGDEMCTGGPAEPPRCHPAPMRVPIP